MPPLMSFIARNGRPSGSVPTWWTGGIAGCCSWPVIRASSRKRRAAGEFGRIAVVEELDRDVAIEGDLAGAIDHAHSAGTHLLE